MVSAMEKIKRKIWILIGILIIALLPGCGQKTGSDDKLGQESTNISKIFSKHLDGFEDTGNGSIRLESGNSSSENGIPVLRVSSENVLVQLRLIVSDFDVNHISYVYVDGVIFLTRQFGSADNYLNLSGDSLEAGTHHVEVIQYDNNDESGNVITYKQADYEVIHNN